MFAVLLIGNTSEANMTDTSHNTCILSPDERHNEPRVPVPPKAVVIESDRFCQQVMLVNVTSMGFLAKSRLHYAPGERLHVHLDDADIVEAHAAWWADGLLGARFVSKLADDVSSELLHAVTTRPPLAGFAEAA